MCNYIAVDQYGNYVAIERHPRKELMEWAGRNSASKMYVDTKQGTTKHIGYVVGNHWFRVMGIEGNVFAREE